MLQGHTDLILSVAASPDGRFLASTSKDRTVRWVLYFLPFLWAWRHQLLSSSLRVWNTKTRKCVGICQGHTEAVGAVAWPFRAKRFAANATPWLASASRDKTIKVSLGFSSRYRLVLTKQSDVER